MHLTLIDVHISVMWLFVYYIMVTLRYSSYVCGDAMPCSCAVTQHEKHVRVYAEVKSA